MRILGRLRWTKGAAQRSQEGARARARTGSVRKAAWEREARSVGQTLKRASRAHTHTHTTHRRKNLALWDTTRVVKITSSSIDVRTYDRTSPCTLSPLSRWRASALSIWRAASLFCKRDELETGLLCARFRRGQHPPLALVMRAAFLLLAGSLSRAVAQNPQIAAYDSSPLSGGGPAGAPSVLALSSSSHTIQAAMRKTSRSTSSRYFLSSR